MAISAGGFTRDMKVSFILTSCFFILCASLASAEIMIRVDANGKKVFYNLPEKNQPTIVKAGKPLQVRVQQFDPMIEAACNKYQVDPDLVKAVIQVESAYNSKALSHAGAIGLMQLMPATAMRFGVKQIYDPEENIHGGVQYLKFLMDRFDNDLSLTVAAYNAGEGAVQKYGAVPKYTETQNYVKRVLQLYGRGDVPETFVVAPKTVYRYADASGVIHFTTERPKSGEFTEIKLAL
jgi:soluble lytic murein transglycosylase-like protein